MANETYSNWHSVSDGDVELYNPQTIVEVDEPIAVTDSEIQWEGIETSETERDGVGSTDDSEYDSERASLNLPETPPGYTFTSHTYRVNLRNNTDSDQEYDINFGSPWETKSESGTISSNTTEEIYVYYNHDENYVGEEVWAEKQTYTDNSIEVLVEATTFSEREMTYYYDTENPSVSGDVSGSYDGTVDDGETTPWQPLSGLSRDDYTFSHDISGSGEANFRFRFEWEYAAPDPIEYYHISVNGTEYELPLVDPTDSVLEYNNYRFYVGGEELAADLVDISDEDASPYRIHIPDVGIVAWREDVQ